MDLGITPWDSAEFIRDSIDAGYFLEAALEDSNADYVAHALSTCARALGGAEVLAREAGISEAEVRSAIAARDERTYELARTIMHTFVPETIKAQVA